MKYIIFSLFLIALLGCETYTPRYTFRAIGTQSNDPEGFQPLGFPLKTKISFRGYKELGDDIKTLILRFDMQITNNGDEPVVLRPNEYSVLDDENRRFTPDLSYDKGAAHSINLRPSSSIKLTLYYPLPSGYQLREVGSFRLTWNYQIGEQKYRRVTKFIKREVDYYYSPYYYDPYYYHHHRRYHSPWRFRFGFHHRLHCY